MVKVLLDEILYIEGLNDYIRIVTFNKTIISKHVLSSLEDMLPNSFIRIHKSFIVATNKIESFNADSVEIGKKEIPIGRLFKFNLSKILNSSTASQTITTSIQSSLNKKNNNTT